jgi:hypothetical protein
MNPDLATPHADVTRRHVRIRPDVTLQFEHERLAETHHFSVRLRLRIEVRTALAATHGQGRQRVLEDLFEAQELENRRIHAGVEAQATLVRPQGAAELETEAAVYLHPPPIIRPRHPEDDLALGLHQTLQNPGLLILRIALQNRRQRTHYLAHRLQELQLARIALLNHRQHALYVVHRDALSACALDARLAHAARSACLRGRIGKRLPIVVYSICRWWRRKMPMRDYFASCGNKVWAVVFSPKGAFRAPRALPWVPVHSAD